MRRPRKHGQEECERQEEPLHVDRDWRKLVWCPTDHNRLTRRHLQHWQWRLHPKSFVLLKPAVLDGKSTRRAVVAFTRDGTHCDPDAVIRDEDPMQYGDDVVTTTMDVMYGTPIGAHVLTFEAQEVPNALILRYVLFGPGQVSINEFLADPLPDSVWDYTCEHPDAPGVRLPGPPALYEPAVPPPAPPKPRHVTFDFD